MLHNLTKERRVIKFCEGVFLFHLGYRFAQWHVPVCITTYLLFSFLFVESIEFEKCILLDCLGYGMWQVMYAESGAGPGKNHGV